MSAPTAAERLWRVLYGSERRGAVLSESMGHDAARRIEELKRQVAELRGVCPECGQEVRR